MNSEWLKENWFRAVALVALGILVGGLLTTYFKTETRGPNNVDLVVVQISEIESRLSDVEVIYDACGQVRLFYVEESNRLCASAVHFQEWARGFVPEPQLSNAKRELLSLADIVDEMSFAIVIDKNYDPRLFDKFDREIPVAVSSVDEELLRVSRELGLDN